MSPELGTLQSRGRIYGCNASLVNTNMALAIWGRTIYVPRIEKGIKLSRDGRRRLVAPEWTQLPGGD